MKKIILGIIFVAICSVVWLSISTSSSYDKLSDSDKEVFIAIKELKRIGGLEDRLFVSANPVPGKNNEWQVLFARPNATDTEVIFIVDIKDRKIIKVTYGVA